MKVAIVIPARVDSRRLPCKVLEPIGIKPMIVHVVDRALESKVGDVFVATPSLRVFNTVDFHFNSEHNKDSSVPKRVNGILTVGRQINSGTERVQFAMEDYPEYDIVVVLQGDSPFMSKNDIRKCVQYMKDHKIVDVVTTVSQCQPGDVENPSVVKSFVHPITNTVWDCRRRISPVMIGNPTKKSGLYVYRRTALERYVKTEPSEHEVKEGLEQLRMILNPEKFIFHALFTQTYPLSVDTKEDLERARAYYFKIGR